MAAIVARGLGRSFAGRVAVEGLDLTVEEGEVFGLLGPNGAGKTTTIRMLCGLLSKTAGQAQVLGYELGRDDLAIRQNVGLLTEQPGLYDRLSAFDNLAYFARLYGVPEGELRGRIEKKLAFFGLAGRAQEKVGGFSKGMRQKLAIARALMHEPRLVFLDEPTSGLDPEASASVRELVQQLSGQGRTVVLCTHNLDEVERLCGRLAVIKGRILAMGPVRDLTSPSGAVEVELEGEAQGLCQPLRAEPGVVAVGAEGRLLKVDLADGAKVPELVAKLVSLGARIRGVRPGRRELERAYLELVKGERQNEIVDQRAAI